MDDLPVRPDIDAAAMLTYRAAWMRDRSSTRGAGTPAYTAAAAAAKLTATENAQKIFEDVEYCADAYQTAEGADVLVLATEWNEFRALNFERIGKALREPVIVDLRNVYEPHRMAALGFRYTSIGRVDERRKRPR